MTDPVVNIKVALEHGLSEEEYTWILGILGRIPTYTELGIFSVMWSEHCSYKNSIAVLKKLPRAGKHLLVQAGEENAGLVDIGDGLAIAFKIESHNHPSAIEPYHGAATGVGGILRDIFTMGARPIALLNSLRFGNPQDHKVQYLLREVVHGISDYGNSFGVPTVGGEIYFDNCYTENPLVNAMAVGVLSVNSIARSTAKGIGNDVLIVGSLTGRDGIHGATFASEIISDESENRRPSVQVGDPFTEKLLLEATLEAIKTGHIVGIQDMGAAGISCSTAEMSAKGGVGIAVDLDKVPLREEGMTPYEIMLSESQERMLVITEQGWTEHIKSIYSKWDIPAHVIGRIDDSAQLRVKKDGAVIASIPSTALVLGGGAPVYLRPSAEPKYFRKLRFFDFDSIAEPTDLGECVIKLISSPNIGSKRWVFEQYDSMVRTDTLVQTEGDAAVIRIKDTTKQIALSTDCNSRYVYINPRRGGMIAVAEAARNVVCVGAKPLAITNCLNFGNPYDPEVFWQFHEAVEGIGEACRILNTPVTGGNVSFYNESSTGPIYPTPVIGMLGLFETERIAIPSYFQDDDDLIVLLGTPLGQIGGSEYLERIHQTVAGDAPLIDLSKEKRTHKAYLQMVNLGLVKSCHDVSEGGLATCIAESCISGPDMIGGEIDLKIKGRKDFGLFAEDQSLLVISIRPNNLESVLKIANSHSISIQKIGITGGSTYVWKGYFELDLASLRKKWKNTFRKMNQHNL